MFKEKHVFEIDYDDLEEIVRLVYSKEYSFVADEECGNDSSHSFMAEKGELSKWGEANIAKFIETGHYSFLTRDLLDDMANFDILPEGNWLVEVMW